MWATVGDRVRYYESKDGVKWEGGETVLAAQAGTWEVDGGSFEGYIGGISDPRVFKNSRPGSGPGAEAGSRPASASKYVMYYTAGPAPNTGERGGMGVAYSDNGRDWTRSTRNPIRRFPGGNTFAVQAIEINGINYVYFLGGGGQEKAIPPDLRVMQAFDDGTFGPDRVLKSISNAYPLFFDPRSQTCWLSENVWTSGVSSGPTSMIVYKGSDCFSTRGEKVVQIDSALSGLATNFGGQIVQKDARGQLSPRASSLTFVFSAGNQWGNWQPRAVRF
jgi:hypothetical protein